MEIKLRDKRRPEVKDRGGGRSQCGEGGAGAPEDPQQVQGQGGGGVEHLGEDPHLGQGMAARTPSEMQLQYIYLGFF